MNSNLYNPRDPVHRVLDWCLYAVTAVCVAYSVYAFYQAM